MSTKKNKNLGLAVIGDNPITAMDMLKQELSELRMITETQYKTEGIVQGFSKPIQEETSISTLVSMHSSITGRRDAYNRSQDTLAARVGALQVPVFKINGHSVEALEDDIVLRINVLRVSERKATLEALIKEGEQFLTKEHQFEMYKKKVAAATGQSM